MDIWLNMGEKKTSQSPLIIIHILSEGGVLEFIEGKFEDGAHSSALGSVFG